MLPKTLKYGSKIESAYARSMKRVLTAVSLTDGMGYCQGMNYAVDMFLKVVPEREAF